MPSALVYCCICGIACDPSDPAVTYRSLDRKWWCADETDCTDRAARASLALLADQARAGELADMDRALESVWADLEANGWKL